MDDPKEIAFPSYAFETPPNGDKMESYAVPVLK